MDKRGQAEWSVISLGRLKKAVLSKVKKFAESRLVSHEREKEREREREKERE